MSLLASYRAKKAIEVLLSADEAPGPEVEHAAARIAEIGHPAVPELLAALSRGRARETLIRLLEPLVDKKTLPHFRRALLGGDPRVVEGAAAVLARCRSFDAGSLVDLFEDPDAPKITLAEILAHHPDAVNPMPLLRLADRADEPTRAALFQLLRAVVTEARVPDLVDRLASDDPRIRLELVRTLGRFKVGAARAALLARVAEDPAKEVRLAALESLLEAEPPPPAAALCGLLRDKDMFVRNRAIEALARLGPADTAEHLLPLLEDRSENVRRAAVEVLNEVDATAAVAGLVAALGDADWWVRVRAADALVRLGGPAVAEAVLPQVLEEDPTRREAAVDVLQRTHGEGTFQLLVDALGDDSSQIRDRAVDALAALEGESRAPSPASRLLRQPATEQAVITALGDLGDPRAIPTVLQRLESGDVAVRKRALAALQKLADKQHAGAVIDAVERLLEKDHDSELRQMSMATVRHLHGKLEVETPRPDSRPSPQSPTPITEPAVVDLSRGIDRTMPPVDPLRLTEGEVLAGRYRVIRQVGRGGFGVVVLVLDLMVQDEIILKFLGSHVAGDPSAVERFKHELRYARRITHENVIRIYDIISFGSSLAISMEYFESHSLASELRRGIPFDLKRGLGILRGVCSGLAVAHRERVVHRDLKPGNILIDRHDRVKLVDFGLSAAASQGASRLTRSGLLIGTPTYMAPEQIRGRRVDARTDIYSLGVLMYELFAGRAPYDGAESMSVLFQHIEGKAPPPRELNPEIPPAVEPQDRYQDAESLRQDLKAAARAVES